MAGTYKETVFWTPQGRCSYEFTVVVTAHTRPVHTLVKQNPSME